MNEPFPKPTPYQVAYSEYVQTELRALVAQAARQGRAREVLEAVKALDQRLRIFPQFGDPLRNLLLPAAQLWIGCIPPLVVRYVLDEGQRTVLVVAPFMRFSRSGPNS